MNDFLWLLMTLLNSWLFYRIGYDRAATRAIVASHAALDEDDSDGAIHHAKAILKAFPP